MRDNPLQFGAVREDPRLEREVLTRFACQQPLVVGSGGCTVLALARWFPDRSFTAIDPNPAQLAHIATKEAALRRGATLEEFSELAEAGNFESLFRMFREFVHDLVVPRQRWLEYFSGGAPNPIVDAMQTPMWTVAFELAFSDALLTVMFGEAATQHARPGSYPSYFRQALESGLARADARHNPFLHHIFLGYYVAGAEPDFVGASSQRASVELVQGWIEDVDFGAHDFIGLSNVLDWMSSDDIERLMGQLARDARPGTVVMWRQLNNERPLFELLGTGFETLHHLGDSLRAHDRSLFYRRIHVCRRS